MKQVIGAGTASSKIKSVLMLFSVLLLVAITALGLCGCSLSCKEDQFSIDTEEEQSRLQGGEEEEEPAQEETPATELVFDNGNPKVVFNSPSAPTVFTLPEELHIYHIVDYHWNDGAGAAPGTIALKDTSSGAMYGPWQTTGTPGQGGVPDAYWNAYPDIDLPAGTYEVIDSDPGTWSQNEDSGGCGMVRIEAVAD